MNFRPSTPRFFFLLLLAATDTTPQNSTPVTLLPTTSPSAGQPGVTNISVTGSNFPAGAITANAVTISLRPAAGGAPTNTPATTVATIVGSTRRVSFTIPATITVAAATNYLVSLSGTTSTGTAFASSNTSALTINPGASISSVAPSSGYLGQTLTATVTGTLTNFVQGSTKMSFGPGVSVGGAPAGSLGPVTVTSSTTGTVQLAISATAATGSRTVTAQTGIQQAIKTAGFSVTSPLAPQISDFNPKSAAPGALVKVTGGNLAGTGLVPSVSLTQQDGGAVTAPVLSANTGSVVFVVPRGAVTSPISLSVAGQTTASASPLTITGDATFTISAAPSPVNVIQGQSAAFAISMTGSNGFNGLAALSLSGLPNGVTANFTPANITVGQTAVATVNVPASQASGPSLLTVTASTVVNGVALSQSASTQLVVQSPTTALIGRTVAANASETPVEGVTVTMLGKDGNGNTTGCVGNAISDPAGNFALTNLPLACVGPQLVGFDGTTATGGLGKFAGVNLVFTLSAGQATPSPALVHLPPIDNVETFLVKQKSPTDQTYAWKSIPGLSVIVYAGTTFTMPDGTMPDPFPLAAVQVPADRLPDIKPPVPTMMTVFIVAFQPANASTNQPVAVYYPNPLNNQPGADMSLLTLDPTRGKMVPYGSGTVSDDGTQIVPDLDPAYPGHRFGLVHFDWHMPGYPPGNQVNPCDCVPCPRCGGSVDLSTGLEVIQETDISFGGARGSISIVRTYRNFMNPAATTFGPFGYGTNHNWAYELDSINPSAASVINLIMPDGNRFPFSKSAAGTFTTSGVPILGGGVMTVNGGTVSLRWKDGTTWGFISILQARVARNLLDSITDPNGNRFQIVHNGFQIQSIVDPTGRALNFNYNVGGCITQITAPDGTFVSYDYGGGGSRCTNATDPTVVANLLQITRTDGSITQYSYDSITHNLTAVTDAIGATFDSIRYDSNNRVIQERLGNGAVLQYAYMLQNPTNALYSPVLATTVTDALGNQTLYRFNGSQGVTSVTDPLGRIRTINRDGGNYVVGYTGTGTCGVCGDPTRGNEQFSYDDTTGNLLSYTDGLGNKTTYTYDPTFNKPTAIKDPFGNTTTFTLDSHGNRLTQKDPNGNVTTYAYDSFGELITVIDPLNQATSYLYDTFGNVASIQDPFGNFISFGYDANGRLKVIADPVANLRSFTYDGSGRLLSETLAPGNSTKYTYDELGDLLTVTDARGSKTAFTYDLTRELLTRTDPLGPNDSRTYDGNGNLTQFIDRKGQTSTFSYDVANRLVTETYSDSTVQRSYDANDRLTQVTDSAAGVFTFSYDSAGRLLGSTTPVGAVQYARDALGRALSRQVVGQSQITYAYDPAGNLSSVVMPQMAASFAYDARNNLASLTRQNGVVSTFSYDRMARLLGITHQNGPNILDTEAYTYDAIGNRNRHTTLIGQPLTTPAVSPAAYDADNEQLQFVPSTNSFDADGNLTSTTTPSGITTYTWDSRSRLTSIVTSAGQTTTFTYDFGGNLITQIDSGLSVNLTRTLVLDDLTNIAYESASDGTSYSVLSGQAIDSHLATIQSNGQIQYGLPDAINSTVATVDQTGAIQSQFTYEPFGQTTPMGSYPFQYAGRVLVTSGLYYNRARFYNSQTGRFISEDPIGFGGGDANLYRYVGNNPQSRTDPGGTFDRYTVYQFLCGQALGAIIPGDLPWWFSNITTIGNVCEQLFPRPLPPFHWVECSLLPGQPPVIIRREHPPEFEVNISGQ
jgi:RHS repeat-associated protein